MPSLVRRLRRVIKADHNPFAILNRQDQRFAVWLLDPVLPEPAVNY